MKVVKKRKSHKYIINLIKDNIRIRRLIKKGEKMKHLKSYKEPLILNYKSIDDFTSGLKPKDLFLLAAKNSINKSSFAYRIIIDLAKCNKKIVLFSIEEAKSKIISNIPEMNNENIIIIDDRIITVNEMMDICKEHLDADLIVADNLSLIEGNWINPWKRNNNLCYKLKILAKSTNIPIIALATLPKSIERIPIQKPDYDKCERGYLLDARKYADYFMILYNNYCYYDQYKYDNSMFKYELLNCHTNSIIEDTIVFNAETYDFKLETSKMRELISRARSLGLEEKDATRFAIYWDDKKIDNANNDFDTKQDENGEWVLK